MVSPGLTKVAGKAAVLTKRNASNAKKLGTFHLSVEAQISPQEVAPTADNALAQTANNALALSDRIPTRRGLT